MKSRLLKSLLFVPFIGGAGEPANAAVLDGAVYEIENQHKSLVKSLEPALGEKMDVQVIAARYVPEKNSTTILLKASDLNIRNERYRDSPLLLRDDDAGYANKMARSYGLEPGFNVVVTEHGKIIPSTMFVQPLGFYNMAQLVLITYESYGGAPNPSWKDVRVKLSLPKEAGYTYVGNFDLGRYESKELDPQQPFLYLYQIADRDLNLEYQSTVARLKATNKLDSITQLRSGERDWVKLKEQQCSDIGEWQRAGTVGKCKFDYTLERINHLREIK